MRRPRHRSPCALSVLAVLLVPAVIGAQGRLDPLVPAADEVALRTLIPAAHSFELVETPLRHFRAYAPPASGGGQTLVGFAFFTTDVTPRLYAYKGRITLLVGMDTAGSLIDVQVVYHYEPFGYFSIDPPQFAAQFKNKSILDPLEVGEDIDAVSRATITVTAATRAIRQGARLLARAFLAEQDTDK